MEKRFLSTKEIAVYLGLAEPTIRFWVRKAKMPYSKFGCSVRFDLREIEKWIKNGAKPSLIVKKLLDNKLVVNTTLLASSLKANRNSVRY